MKRIPLVSLCCITYNHEKFLNDTLHGFLIQHGDFNKEIIVFDDASTDRTWETVQNFLNDYPMQGKLRRSEINVGMNKNCFDALSACSGDYIALCEGDDYWTDPLKLQKQVDFLESNPDFAICFHNARILKEGDEQNISFSNPENQKEVTTFEDLAGGEYIYTATCMFRAKNMMLYPPKFYMYINNYTIDLHNAQFGKVKYINEVMGVYRVHAKGVWSMVPRLKTLKNHLPAYEFYINYFPRQYRHYFIKQVQLIAKERMELTMHHKDGSFWPAFVSYTKNYWKTKEGRRMIVFYLKSHFAKNVKLLLAKS
jgi:glycosyltransferase involved in cell wall biosynthesis